MTRLSEDAVRQALRAVQDPDLGRDIVSLGFVKEVRIDGGRVGVRIELTTPACPVKEQLRSQAEAAIRAVAGVEAVEIQMTSSVQAAASRGAPNPMPQVRQVVAVASGKGGVGKSTVSSNLALALARTGARVGLLDADIYGPSIPLMFGTLASRPEVTAERQIHPIDGHGIHLMSMGFLTTEDTPVIWRGPMVHGVLQQFLTSVVWPELDYLVVDLPPGTGDAQLTLTQSAPLSGAVIVTTPQDVSLLDARKGLRMFQSVKVPVLGIVENMSAFVCGHCGEETAIFGKGGGERVAKELGIPFLGAIPIDPEVVRGGDEGTPIVARRPDSPAAKAFREVAGLLAAKLSMLGYQGGGGAASIDVQWQETPS